MTHSVILRYYKAKTKTALQISILSVTVDITTTLRQGFII